MSKLAMPDDCCTEIDPCPTCQANLEYDYDVKRIGQDEADDLPDRNYEENPLHHDEITWMKKCLKNPKKCRVFMEDFVRTMTDPNPICIEQFGIAEAKTHEGCKDCVWVMCPTCRKMFVPEQLNNEYVCEFCEEAGI